jgi:fructose-bisphosphate aldolase class 1
LQYRNKTPAFTPITDMKPFLRLSRVVTLATVASAFSLEGTPLKMNPNAPNLALSDVANRAATAALVVALTLVPIVEPALAATSATYEDVMNAIAKLGVKIEVSRAETKTELANLRNDFLIVPITGVVVTGAVLILANIKDDEAVVKSKQEASKGVQQLKNDEVRST